MLRLHGVLGHSSDPSFRGRLHRLEHSDGIELLFVPPEDVGRRRFRADTDRGTDCAVSFDRDGDLQDGDVLYLDEARAVIVRFGAEKVWRLRPRDQAAALKLGWNAGNLHWRVRFDGDGLAILLDAPLETYRARVRSLLEDGSVEELGADV
ncbi:urease accessory protein [Bradyrhizobium sp. AZCC 2262]|uniref:urease accessory protein UreE n=1 Tax=Bradyrhizobium sp. AZCC 2262 TaxID=3117022 RepID=UPI002FF2D64E